jgi:hypothetical protein
MYYKKITLYDNEWTSSMAITNKNKYLRSKSLSKVKPKSSYSLF